MRIRMASHITRLTREEFKSRRAAKSRSARGVQRVNTTQFLNVTRNRRSILPPSSRQSSVWLDRQHGLPIRPVSLGSGGFLT